MLKHLHIQNYALIQQLDLDLDSGFSVITGQTGAGKSILLGAIGLLLGQRADSHSIQTGATRCIIEATFDISAYGLQEFFDREELDFDGQECILRRELTAAGKSRAFINDTPATVVQLRELGSYLIDIHSQHQNLLLAREDFQIGVLDILAQQQEDVAAYRREYHAWREAQRLLSEAQEKADSEQQEEDFLRFQLEQLTEMKLQTGEEESLRETVDTLSHAEDIKGGLYQTEAILSNDEGGILDALRTCHNNMQQLCRLYPKAQELADRLDSCLIELKDIASELTDQAESIEYDPAALAQASERLDGIYSLEHKHHVDSIEALLDLQERLGQQLDAIENADERIQQLQQAVAQHEAQLRQQAKVLSNGREKAAQIVEQQMQQGLIPLGMPNVRFHVDIQPSQEPMTTGMDRITFLFSANKNASLQPVSQVASGGEIARVMLCLKSLISGATQLPTIIFDEIDTGVSGQIAECMAQMMRQMGNRTGRQVISITHLPQIAALGAHHYRVWKEDTDDTTLSHITPLDTEERVQELAHMLSGARLTEAAISNARALLNQ